MNGGGDVGGVRWWLKAAFPGSAAGQKKHTEPATQQHDECAVQGGSGVVRVPTTTMANSCGRGVVVGAVVRPHKLSICT